MRLALVDGRRCGARPGLDGICQGCQSPVIPRCGTHRVWHWAHQSKRTCDPWWEETKWHIDWKNRFPLEWQEIVQTGPDGELHIADVKLPEGRVLEFQHSPIAEEERRSREAFYGSMIWIVDGLRRKRDQETFAKTLRIDSRDPLVYSGFEGTCALLRDWVGRPADVIFDFGTRDEDIATFGRPVLWQLHPDPQRHVILTPIYTDAFIETLHNGAALRRISRKPAPGSTPSIPPTSDRPYQYPRHLDRRRFRF